jgi:AcrR family transcriptional regulator
MGRKREFDADHALAVATDLFWRLGYEKTSVSQLTEAMGITPPSFYLAFKSKEALFLRLVAVQQERQGKIIAAAFSQGDSASLVRVLLEGFADELTLPGRAKGCLMLNNALPAAAGDAFRSEWAGWRDRLKRDLGKRFASDRAKGVFPSNADPKGLAQLIAALLWGFAVEAASGATRVALRTAVDEFMAIEAARSPSPLNKAIC